MTRRRMVAAAPLLGLLALDPAGCRGSRASGTTTDAEGIPAWLELPAAEPQQVGPARPIEMFSWWERIGDSDALAALVRQHRSRFPADIIINASAGLSGLARKTLRIRILRSEPPDTFQANAGHDLLQWVRMNGIDARETRLMPLDDVLEDVATWRRVMPEAVLANVSFDGKLYGVPSNVHRLNTVYYNKQVFARFALTEPTSLEDLVAMGEKLRGSGVPLIAVGSREPWTLAVLIFECLLVAREGPRFYDDYFRGRLTAEDPRLLGTLQASLPLFRYVNSDHQNLSWLQAVELVARGRAAMTVMGDWARMSFAAHGMVFDRDFGEIAFPGSAGTFVFTADAFALPREARNKGGAKRLLVTIGSKEGQRQTNDTKWALSARLDVPPPTADRSLSAKYALLKKGPLVLAQSGIAPAQFQEDVNAALAEMVQLEDTGPAVHTLRSRYALLK